MSIRGELTYDLGCDRTWNTTKQDIEGSSAVCSSTGRFFTTLFWGKKASFFFYCPTDNTWESIGFMSNSQKTKPYIFNGGEPQYVFKCMKKALERSTPGIKHELYLNKAVVYKEEPGISLSVHPRGTDYDLGPLGEGEGS